MAVVVAGPPALSADLALYHTTDPLLANSPVLIFHGTAATIGATSSRIQVHIFTPAGLGSYSRLAVSPNSPLYSAVSNLPREEQGDEITRGLAFGLKKYFTDLSDGVKKAWQATSRTPLGALFGDDHIAILASRMTKIENVHEVMEDLQRAFGERNVPWLDVDVVLPPGTIKEAPKRTDSAGPEELDETEALRDRYGSYAELIAALGEPTCLPTSRLKRAPSKANTIGRSSSFLKHQKENARKEISELFETEVNYVARMRELRSLAESLGGDLKATSKQQLKEVFPESIDAITEVNQGFLDALQSVLNETEEPAYLEIDAMPSEEGAEGAELTQQDSKEDGQGIVAIADCLCEWLPKFADSYAAYTKSHAAAALQLRSILRESESALSAELHEVGEQKLTSLLIEPVQRLPRYNLYIDSIAKQLPVRHPALKLLMRARDLVSDICTHNDAELEALDMAGKLRTRVTGWPADAQVPGRLVTATDAVELAPPYGLDNCIAQAVLLLVFTDSIVFLERRGSSATSARTLLTELDSQSYAKPTAQMRPGTPSDLRFLRRVQLGSVEVTEALEDLALHVMTYSPLPESVSAPGGPFVDSQQMLLLEGAYEGKASRLLEDITKAKIEGRFSELEREASKWDFITGTQMPEQLTMLSAVFEESNQEHLAARQGRASTRIVLDLEKHSSRPRAGQYGIRTVVALTPQRDGTCRVSIDSIDGLGSREFVPLHDTVSYVCKKLAILTAGRFSIHKPAMTASHLVHNAEALRLLELEVRPEDEQDIHPVRTRSNSSRHRPKSPVKMLSSFLSSTGPGSQSPSFLKKDTPTLSSFRMPPPPQSMPAKPPSRDSRPSSKDQPTPQSVKSMQSIETLSGPFKKLEDALSTFVLALLARKGNIVGRSLKARATADETMVAEVCDSVIEDPNMMVLAAQASVDVLFAAFEKFIHGAWKEQFGPLVPFVTMQEIQSKAETLFPVDFDEYFKLAMSLLAPSNQRAFKGIMRLLAELLDGTGNDGDRGILTAAFAEVLVTEGNPHDFVALIDRFVEDTDTYFGEPLAEAQNHPDGFAGGHKRSRSINAGSLNSNTSSLRRKFGFSGLSRENSKAENDSKVASVWRTLSKSTRGESPASSISRGTLHRSHSTDIDGRLNGRPTSQEGPQGPPPPRKGSVPDIALTGPAQNSTLGTIGEHPSFIPTGPPKKKRRSSLSDLLEVSQKSPPWSPPATRQPTMGHHVSFDKSLPASPSLSQQSSQAGSGRFGTPVRETPRSRLPASFKKENSPTHAQTPPPPAPLRPKTSGSITAPADEVTITARPTSNIPTLTPKSGPSRHRKTISTPQAQVRNGLSERPGLGNIVKKPSPQAEKTVRPALNSFHSTGQIPSPATPGKRLRMQSPQKLRERLQNEQSAISAAHNNLQDELSRIGDELTLTPSRMGSVRTPKPLNVRPSTANLAASTSAATQPPATLDIAQRLLKLESHLPDQYTDVTTRLNNIQSDLTSSLAVSESKCRKLDELYREANGENEALYARFNDELGRILKAVKGGEGTEECRNKLKENQDEVARLKRENGRLKRENLGLRAQLRE